jgi:ABC-type nitrate/sulfonate/bicarbonate transport system substrate-binding protein
MWEHFTSKRYYDNGSIKRIGEIYTPWSSWKIVASTTTTKSSDSRLEDLFTKLDQGIKYFEENPEENVKYISTELDYSEADAREWLGTVKFSKATKGVDRSVIEGTIDILRKAGVLPLGEGTVKAEEMIDVQR